MPGVSFRPAARRTARGSARPTSGRRSAGLGDGITVGCGRSSRAAGAAICRRNRDASTNALCEPAIAVPAGRRECPSSRAPTGEIDQASVLCVSWGGRWGRVFRSWPTGCLRTARMRGTSPSSRPARSRGSRPDTAQLPILLAQLDEALRPRCRSGRDVGVHHAVADEARAWEFSAEADRRAAPVPQCPSPAGSGCSVTVVCGPNR